MPSPSSSGSGQAAPSQPPAKGNAATPKLNNELEMGNMTANEPAEPDIMNLARIGDVAAMQKLFDTDEYDATYTDAEGITPLHWAAINNQYAMCKFLIDNGAPINQKGGESVATPLQWASQRCHYYTVHLLLQRGADPLITDSQGYNTLHISTFNGNVLLLVLLLHQGIPVDVLDGFGHTGLMWSAYKGFPACVDLFLRWGASVEARDEQGFTALHWALVKGSPGCIQKLIEYGADRFAKTSTGKTPAITAQELNTVAAWHKALHESGYDEDANPVTPTFPGAAYFLKDRRAFVTKFLFLWPFVLLWAVIAILAGLPIFLGLPLSLLAGYAMQWVAQQVDHYAPPDMRQLQKTPWLAGIFAGSLFLLGANWLFRIFPAMTWRAPNPDDTHWFLNLFFALFYGLTGYFYAACMISDPGFVPKLNGIAEQKAVIDELIAEWKFDEVNFCVTCMIRTPLRSKHCRRCHRCVAKHDHHCPWVYNCVAVNNHRQFFLYLISLTISICLYDWIVYDYMLAAAATASDVCNVLSPALCKFFNADAFSLIASFWGTLQLSWVSMLLFVQFIQVSRAMTTYENMYGIDRNAASSLTSAFTSTGAPLDPNHPNAVRPAAPAPANASSQGHHGHQHGSFLKQWSKILGVDTFIETATGRGAATGKSKKQRKNPYSRGCLTNCKDFWCDPAPIFGHRETGSAVLGGHTINYMEMYESPALMELTRSRKAGQRGTYEAVASEEV